MDVYLVPSGTGEYQLYCETAAPAPAVEGTQPNEPHDVASWRARLRHRWRQLRDRAAEVFTHAVAEGEQLQMGAPADARHSRVRRIVTRHLADAVAEQRLLWHLRHEDRARLLHPDDLGGTEAIDRARHLIGVDRDKHRRWLIIDGLLVLAATPLALLPGPNVFAYYFVFRTVGHYLSMKGAQQGLSTVTWAAEPSAPLTALRTALPLEPSARGIRLDEISRALGLERLGLFVDRIVERT
jgi:hypothetical protein